MRNFIDRAGRPFMKYLNLAKVTIFILYVVISSSFGSAQEGIKGGQSLKYKVIKGFAEANSVKYPVFIGVREVDATQSGGITFAVTQKNHKQALLMAEKLKRFYLGKKIGKVSLPQFKKVSKPEIIAWNSIKCGSSNEGAHAVVKVDDKTVSVFLFPSCDEGVLALIL
jgi:hypothetical protein